MRRTCIYQARCSLAPQNEIRLMHASPDIETPDVSVIIPSLNESWLRRTVENVGPTLPTNSEIIVVDDGSTDGSTDFLIGATGRVRMIHADRVGVARARNLGARASRGKTIVFADAHLRVEPGWCELLLGLLERASVGAVSAAVTDMFQTDRLGVGLHLTGPDLAVEWLQAGSAGPCQVPLLSGCFWAMRRDVFEATGGFDDGMIRWGCEDTELSIRLWLQGYEVLVSPQTEVRHLFREYLPYDLDWSCLVHNKLRLAYLHFCEDRYKRVVDALRRDESFAAGVKLLEQSDVAERRREFDARRIHDDDWFFNRFGPGW
ncbi:MAG: glycosyl transferase [Acidobacteria bacterium]|nr:MAG: glycosyl transferase [Acidobacteriota bacterium]